MRSNDIFKFVSFLMLIFTLIFTPMAYSSNSDLVNSSDETQILQLVDDANTGIVTLADLEEAVADPGHEQHMLAAQMLERIERARVDADELINTFLRGRHTIPLEPVPAFIADQSINLTIYNLFQRRMRAEMPDEIRQLRKDSIDMLMKVQTGKIKISDSPQVDAGHYAVNKTSRDKIFSSNMLKRF